MRNKLLLALTLLVASLASATCASPGQFTVVNPNLGTIGAQAQITTGPPNGCSINLVNLTASLLQGGTEALVVTVWVHVNSCAQGPGTIVWADDIGVTGTTGDSRTAEYNGPPIFIANAGNICIEFRSTNSGVYQSIAAVLSYS